MVDRDEQDGRDPVDREQGDDTASVETSDEQPGESQPEEPEADAANEEAQAEEQSPEDQRAMPLDDGSDEGGTVAGGSHELYDLEETDGDAAVRCREHRAQRELGPALAVLQNATAAVCVSEMRGDSRRQGHSR